MPEVRARIPSLLILANGGLAQTTGRLLTELGRRLEPAIKCDVKTRRFPSGVLAKIPTFVATELGNLRALRGKKAILAESPAFLALPTLLVAKLSGKRLLVYIWDIYPASFGSPKGPGGRLLHTLVRRLEHFSIALADQVLVSSSDYLEGVRKLGAKNILIIPMWPPDIIYPVRVRSVGDVTRVAWAGQIHPIRGLTQAIRQLLSAFPGKVVLQIFSHDTIPEDLVRLAETNERFSIENKGFKSADILIAELANCDFGLVSIDTGFALPAFPSKIVTYLAAGLPIIYIGPDTPVLRDLFSIKGIGIFVEDGVAIKRLEIESLYANFRAARDKFFNESDQAIATLRRLISESG